MDIDWGEAIKVSGGGFGITILILLILAIASWAMGWILQRTAKRKKENGSEKSEA